MPNEENANFDSNIDVDTNTVENSLKDNVGVTAHDQEANSIHNNGGSISHGSQDFKQFVEQVEKNTKVY